MPQAVVFSFYKEIEDWKPRRLEATWTENNVRLENNNKVTEKYILFLYPFISGFVKNENPVLEGRSLKGYTV